MKKAYVFVRSQTEVAFLKKVLIPESQQNVDFINAHSRDNMTSLAQSFLAMRRQPVAIFTDADTVNPELIQERRDSLEDLLNMAAASVPKKVVFAVPELKAYFFMIPEVIEKVTGAKVPGDWIPFGFRDPEGVFTQLAKTAPRPWNTDQAIAVLDESEIEHLRTASPIQELISFLQRLAKTEPVGATR
jgi:hypothetical protein